MNVDLVNSDLFILLDYANLNFIKCKYLSLYKKRKDYLSANIKIDDHKQQYEIFIDEFLNRFI
jgi:hypothetical protein